MTPEQIATDGAPPVPAEALQRTRFAVVLPALRLLALHVDLTGLTSYREALFLLGQICLREVRATSEERREP